MGIREKIPFTEMLLTPGDAAVLESDEGEVIEIRNVSKNDHLILHNVDIELIEDKDNIKENLSLEE